MNIKRNTLFIPDREKDRLDAKLRYRIKWAGNTVAFNVGYRVDLSKWIPDAQRCKANTTHGNKKISASVINDEITRYENIARTIFNTYEREKRIPTADEFRRDFNTSLGKTVEKESGFFDRWDEFIATMSFQNNWTQSTIRQFGVIRRHLINFNSNLSLSTINENTFDSFIQHLLNLNHRNSYVAKNLRLIKWFLRWAYRREYYTGNLHDVYRPHIKGGDGNNDITYLTWDELINIYNYVFPPDKKHLIRIRDVFCFCCFTSLRYSDVAKLTKSDVKDGYISVITQKTNDTLKIELNKYSSAILDKYKDSDFKNDKALPVLRNCRMNKYLKDIGKLCSLNEQIKIVYFKGNVREEEVYKKWELLTTHCGRRTFVVNALYLGIPAEVVMRWTGHSDFAAMKPYVKIVDDLKRKEMDKFNAR